MVDENTKVSYRIPRHARRNWAFLIREGATYVLRYRGQSRSWEVNPPLGECNKVLDEWGFPREGHSWYGMPQDWAAFGASVDGMMAVPDDDESGELPPEDPARPLS